MDAETSYRGWTEERLRHETNRLLALNRLLDPGVPAEDALREAIWHRLNDIERELRRLGSDLDHRGSGLRLVRG